jgi:hypothetical protein
MRYNGYLNQVTGILPICLVAGNPLGWNVANCSLFCSILYKEIGLFNLKLVQIYTTSTSNKISTHYLHATLRFDIFGKQPFFGT